MRINAKKGFTLLEILIALFIFSIVSVILASALHNVLGTQTEAQKKAERLTHLQVALLLMSRDFTQVIDRPITSVSGVPEGFTGTANTVTFTRAGMENPLGQLQRSTLQRVRYQLNDSILRRFTWPVLDLAQEVKPDARILLDSVSDVRFDYLDDKGRFQTSWPLAGQKNNPLPVAVRVSITLRNWGTISQLYLIAGQSIEKQT